MGILLVYMVGIVSGAFVAHNAGAIPKHGIRFGNCPHAPVVIINIDGNQELQPENMAVMSVVL